jgi:hypothetical protein
MLRQRTVSRSKRFVRKLRAARPERIWRMECQPGEELQLDFGLGAPIEEGQCKRRRSWVLRLVLSYSRKGYSEAVIRQDRDVHSLPGKRSAQPWWVPAITEPRQYEVGGAQGRLV